MNKILTTLIFLFFAGNILAQLSETKEKQQIVYQSDEFITGEFLHDFMLIGPFPNPLPEGVTDYFHLEETCLGFKKDYLTTIGGETSVKPSIGQSVEYMSGEKLEWINYHSESDKIDLKKVFTPNDAVVCYAAIWIESDKEQEKILGVGSNDGIKGWFNGEMILKVHKPRTVNVDDEYLKLKLKKGKNLLLLKIEQGFGGWGFVLRPVDNKTAWEQVQKNLNVAMNSEFYAEGDFITGTVGDNNIVGQLSNLPMANVNFSAIDGSHNKTIETPVGSKLKLSKKDFPADEYAITITFETKGGVKQTYAWMNTSGDVVNETRELIFKELPAAPKSPMANYYNDFVKTVRWLDKANKLWEHPYGYRRYFDGVKNARRGLAKLQNSMNPFNAVFPSPCTTKFQSGECKITADWKILDANKTDDYLTQKIRNFWLETFKTSIQYSGKTGESKTINLNLKPSAKNNESYFIKIDDKNITIEAQSRKGLFYGVSFLIQALSQSTTLPVGTITDQPAYPLRSVMVSSQVKVGMNDEFKTYIKKLANLRYNETYLYSPFYFHLDDEAQLEEIKAVHAFCKAHFIEPVPFFETFGSATLTRVINPELAEGVFHENEKQTVSLTGEINLDVPRIHDHKYSTVHILYNGRELSHDKDFKILSTEKPKIKILDKNLFGKEVSLSYDAVDFSSFSHPASCPSDPRGWELQEKVISSVIKELNPPKLHISQDEAGFVNTCSQCKARGLTNQEIMIDQIQRVHNIIRKYDKNVEIYIWGDLFSDLQNAPKIGAKGIVKGLPKDIMVHDWSYTAVYHSEKMQTINQMNFYLDKGYKTGGVSWFEPANLLDILQAGEGNHNFMGIMHSAWSRFEHGLLPTAEANWTGKTILNKLEF